MNSALPRIAVGTTQAGADGTAMLWALMDSLESAGVRVQSFASRAHFSPRDAATAITGLAPRHLDSWLMGEETCRKLFVRGCRLSDMALVEGSFANPAGSAERGGCLARLCEWLDLPALAIVDARRLECCRLPQRPPRAAGILLDRVRDPREACQLQTQFESLWNLPVVGWLGTLDNMRTAILALESGSRAPIDLCHALCRELLPKVKLDRIHQLASARPFSHCPECPSVAPRANPTLHVAVAYDDALRAYFPDTLDMLEAQGAVVTDFSPLHDDRLPYDTDVVYLGCGHPERYAQALSENDCMMLALKNHLCSGRRIFAECGGLAYLCHELELPGGERWPMVGALDVTAHYCESPSLPDPLELTLASDTWLGAKGQRFRGYRSPRWSISPHGALDGCAAEAGHELDLLARHQAVGSCLHLDFAAQADLLARFFEPHEQGRPLVAPHHTRG